MAAPPLLAVEGITKRYGNFQAISNVTFAVPPGVAFGLAGPNGAGKTTLLQCTVGIRAPSEGRVWVAGEPLTQDNIAARRNLAFVPELPETAASLTPLDHMAFVARVLELPAWEPQAYRLLNAFGMVHKAEKLCRTLSKGEQQKVGLMTALIRR
ncbi:MAG: ATP-binding cassette domain-containing protein, partial [Actinomycetota bacterium]